jgi:hypothetical protein
MQFCVTFAFSYLGFIKFILFQYMDKFLIKRRKNEDESVTERNSIKSENEPFPIVSAAKAVQRGVQSLGTVRK